MSDYENFNNRISKNTNKLNLKSMQIGVDDIEISGHHSEMNLHHIFNYRQDDATDCEHTRCRNNNLFRLFLLQNTKAQAQ